MIDDDRLVTAYDIAPLFCRSGVAEFCRSNGLDYQTFLNPGYPWGRLKQAGDQYVVAAEAHLLAQETDSGQ